MENRDKCPLCRRPLPLPNPTPGWHQELTAELEHLSNDQTLMGGEYAELLLLITTAYTMKLPASFLNIIKSSHPLNIASDTDPTSP
jgi:hypothetical protein